MGGGGGGSGSVFNKAVNAVNTWDDTWGYSKDSMFGNAQWLGDDIINKLSLGSQPARHSRQSHTGGRNGVRDNAQGDYIRSAADLVVSSDDDPKEIINPKKLDDDKSGREPEGGRNRNALAELSEADRGSAYKEHMGKKDKLGRRDILGGRDYLGGNILGG